MSYQIQETDTELKIIITDVQMHIQKAVNPKPWQRMAEKAGRTGKPTRAYTNDMRKNKDGTFTVVFPNEEYERIGKAQKAGKKIRYFIPKQGLYIWPGKDLVEYLKAKEAKVDNKIDTWHAKE